MFFQLNLQFLNSQAHAVSLVTYYSKYDPTPSGQAQKLGKV